MKRGRKRRNSTSRGRGRGRGRVRGRGSGGIMQGNVPAGETSAATGSNMPNNTSQQSQFATPVPSATSRTNVKATNNRPQAATGRGMGGGKVGRGNTRGRGNSRGRRRAERGQVGYGCFVDTVTGATILNLRLPSERVILTGTTKDASTVNVDLGFRPKGLKWKGKTAATTSQLQKQVSKSQAAKRARRDSL